MASMRPYLPVVFLNDVDSFFDELIKKQFQIIVRQ